MDERAEIVAIELAQAARNAGTAFSDFQVAILGATGQLEKLNELLSAMRTNESIEAILQADLTEYDTLLLSSMHITI